MVNIRIYSPPMQICINFKVQPEQMQPFMLGGLILALIFYVVLLTLPAKKLKDSQTGKDEMTHSATYSNLSNTGIEANPPCLRHAGQKST